jgi:hypothetical protein
MMLLCLYPEIQRQRKGVIFKYNNEGEKESNEPDYDEKGDQLEQKQEGDTGE